MLTFIHEGQEYVNFTADQARIAGVPQDVIDAVVQKQRRSKVNDECKRRIYAVASPETQMNMASVSSVISGKNATNRTVQEKAIIAGVEASLGWVSAMRNAAATITADTAIDMLADDVWPACPDAVLAVVGQF